MNIEEIKRKVDEALADKQEFADLAFTLVPELIAEIERLSYDSELLNCLEACGVDNWHGYSEAIAMFEEEDE